MSSTSSKSTGSDASSARPATSMAELMARHGNALDTFKKGQTVKGIITILAAADIFMRVDNKTDVLVIEKDRKLHKQLLTLLHVGETVEATVLYPESDAGYPIVSLRNYMQAKVWDYLQDMQKKGEKLTVTVTETTKGGLVVEADNGMSGFLPNSHMTKTHSNEEVLGQKLQVTIAEISKENRKVVFSQKQALTTDDFANLAKQYKAGTRVSGKVSGVTTFGIFVSLPYEKQGEETTVDGLVHVSELSWEKVADIAELFHSGQTVEAVVIGIDPRSKRIDLSIKRLSADPFQAVLEAFPVDKKVNGTAKEMTQDGLIVDLGIVAGVAVEGLMKKDKIPPTTTYEAGVSVSATVVSVDSRKRKVMLTPVLLEKPLMYR